MRILNTVAALAIPFIPRALIQKISRRYIAGDSLADAVGRVQMLNACGFSTTLDVLGETVSSAAEAETMAGEYVKVLDAIRAHGLNAEISIKPSALGLLVDEAECERLVRHILEVAAVDGNFACVDMEDISCAQKEIDLFARVERNVGNVGLALQAYLKRTYEDIDHLLRKKSTLRICKGIYVEDQVHLVDGARNDRTAINVHFINHVSRCFKVGAFVGIATHDTVLIEEIIALVRREGVDRTKFEFQMLLGVCEPLRDKLLGMGFNVRIYVPYGRDWYGYSTRRIKENPSIAGYVMKAMLGIG
ncbi:L-proline dehydrogenase [Paraburkholderia sp. 1N]|uniref:proline dehydrogenase n=1 Tax=Paraburkholderia solitsugae TaxID=2675748 RepID=A0ABX2BNE4_9BURK|nr:proline dehydrogenase family protein [Paraburkholderia solitsugae]NPT42276.1 L-proline dehydrogenase [Paraburkholderia solitsugae]